MVEEQTTNKYIALSKLFTYLRIKQNPYHPSPQNKLQMKLKFFFFPFSSLSSIALFHYYCLYFSFIIIFLYHFLSVSTVLFLPLLLYFWLCVWDSLRMKSICHKNMLNWLHKILYDIVCDKINKVERQEKTILKISKL